MSDVIVTYPIIEASLNQLLVEGYLKLFSNNFTVTASAGWGSYTEVTGGGYAHATIATANWSTEYSNVPRDVILPQQTYTFTGTIGGSGSAYGWVFVSLDLSTVYAAKNLDTPYTPGAGGGTLKFTPRIQAGNGTPA